MKEKYYTPSNGTEGEWFMDKFCANCCKDTTQRKIDGKTMCNILTKSLLNEQPKEWIYDENDKPVCTSFKDLSQRKIYAKKQPKEQGKLF